MGFRLPLLPAGYAIREKIFEFPLAQPWGLRYINPRAETRTPKLRAFSSGGERFPDTEEVTSSNLVTPTKKSQARDQVSGLFCYVSKLRTNPRCASMPHLDVRKGMPSRDWH